LKTDKETVSKPGISIQKATSNKQATKAGKAHESQQKAAIRGLFHPIKVMI
jgi:hypothetical protein